MANETADQWADQVEPEKEPDAENPALKENVANALDIQLKIIDLEEQLKLQGEKLRLILEKRIPDTLEDMGLDEGSKILVLKHIVEVKKKISASPAKADRPKVYAWLEEHGHGGLIKRNALFIIGKGQDAKAEAWVKSIKTFDGVFIKKVEPATLSSFVRTQIEEGIEIPMDLFGVFEKRAAILKPV